MPEPGRATLALVEHDWRGIRECSLRLRDRGIAVTYLINGTLPADIDELVPRDPLLRLIGMPRRVFRLGLWGILGPMSLLGRLGWLLLDNERTLRQVSGWCRFWRIHPVLVLDTLGDYELREAGTIRTFEELFGPAGDGPPPAVDVLSSTDRLERGRVRGL